MEISGRKFMAIAFTSTYCLAIISSLALTVLNLMKVEVFLGILTGFTPMVVLINQWYFERKDRKKVE